MPASTTDFFGLWFFFPMCCEIYLLSSYHATVNSGTEATAESAVIWQLFLSQRLRFQNCLPMFPLPPSLNIEGDSEKNTAGEPHHPAEIINMEQLVSRCSSHPPVRCYCFPSQNQRIPEWMGEVGKDNSGSPGPTSLLRHPEHMAQSCVQTEISPMREPP